MATQSRRGGPDIWPGFVDALSALFIIVLFVSMVFMGAQFFLWELATAVACYRLGINPFDQPDVESAKVQARKVVAAYQAEGALPESAPAALTAETVQAFLDQAFLDQAFLNLKPQFVVRFDQ